MSAADALRLAQAWAVAEGLEDSRLVFLAKEAVSVFDGEAPDLSLAPLWGLLRSAHSKHPGRFALLDTDDSEASLAALSDGLVATGRSRGFTLAGVPSTFRGWRAPRPRGRDGSSQSTPSPRS